MADSRRKRRKSKAAAKRSTATTERATARRAGSNHARPARTPTGGREDAPSSGNPGGRCFKIEAPPDMGASVVRAVLLGAVPDAAGTPTSQGSGSTEPTTGSASGEGCRQSQASGHASEAIVVAPERGIPPATVAGSGSSLIQLPPSAVEARYWATTYIQEKPQTRFVTGEEAVALATAPYHSLFLRPRSSANPRRAPVRTCY
jgi:hypothetical protein